MMIKQSHRRRRGLTLMEVAISSLLVATVLLTSLTTTANWRRFHFETFERETVNRLANELVSEIISTSFIDPALTTPGTFARESGEGTGNRTTWDDVDDYHGSLETTLADKAGTTIPFTTGYTRSVAISAATPISAVPGYETSPDVNQSLRLISVTVTGPGGISTTVRCLKSNVATDFTSSFNYLRSFTVSIDDGGTTTIRTLATMNQPEVLP
jgi:Tfp pilus assembly protein PilV